MNTLSADYSGIAINYDYMYSHLLSVTNGVPVAQTFVLPVDYVRGTSSGERRIPDISGFQILANINDMSSAAFDWSIGYTYSTSPSVMSQFNIVQSGSTVGTYKDGMVWFDIIFGQPIPVSEDLLDLFWIIQLTPYNINSLTYFEYQGQGFDTRIQAYEIENTFVTVTSSQLSLTALPNSPASFNFRLLSLQADSGIDFIGNQYRSVVTSTPVDNIDTIDQASSIGGIGNYWMSPALPASDAVASLYFDMRPVSDQLQYGLTNLVTNPSFEYDTSTPANWNYNPNGGTMAIFSVTNDIAPYGTKMLRLQVTSVPSGNYVQLFTENYIPITIGKSYAGSSVIQIATPSGCYGVLQFDWYDSTNAYISSTYSTTKVLPGTNQLVSTLIATPPATASSMHVTITVYNTSASSQTIDFRIDGVCLVQDNTVVTYFDGDSAGCQWTGQPGNSSSVQVSNAQLVDEPVVVDAIVLDPLFANQNYNIYYSNDDNGLVGVPVTTTDWENKLWTLATTITASFGNETQVLPQPIGAKYIKIELTNPQMQHYDPGDFQLPIIYKTFPSWVQNYFLSQVHYPSYDADQVLVQSDALGTIYTPYIDDLQPQPTIPNVQTPSYYQTSSNSKAFDNNTLGQIDVNINPYQDTLGTQAQTGTTLGGIVSQQISNVVNGAQQVTEGGAPGFAPITAVSSLERDAVLAELLAPDMYFYYTCRHEYMVKSAVLSNNKAYFFGINNITFLRSQGSVVADTPVYTETGLDMNNSKLNDFTLTSQGWWETYAAS